jgi:hypothetical protein
LWDASRDIFNFLIQKDAMKCRSIIAPAEGLD